MTRLAKAKASEATPEMLKVSKDESIAEKILLERIADGRIVIPASKLHKGVNAIGIGYGLSTKVNANLGSSPVRADIKEELEKARVAIKAGAHTIMDLSTGGDIRRIRQEIIKNSKVPVGTVPIYQAIVEKEIEDLSELDFLRAIQSHIDDGVDFVTIHAGLLRSSIPHARKRLGGVVSRGGAFVVRWMEHNKQENPLYTNFDKILDMARKNDVTLSLGDGLRPGCIKDATDKAQLHELNVLGELQKKALAGDVQVIIEGPGHIPINQIEYNMKLQKKICNNAPFYVLGPLVTDIAPGYDHITAAIGGALAAYHGADFLCFVTPKEHLGLPNIEDVRQGVIASRIAAHAADIAKGIPNARQWDDSMSEARFNLNWEKMFDLAIDRETAIKYREECAPKNGKNGKDVCSMCGRFCSIKNFNAVKEGE